MTDSVLLKQIIKSKGLKLSFVAEKLGITSTCLSRKLGNKSSFDQIEILNLIRLLQLSTEQVNAIFFAK